MFSIASFLALACEIQPGKEGYSTTKAPSSSCSMMIRYFIGLPPVFSCILQQPHMTRGKTGETVCPSWERAAREPMLLSESAFQHSAISREPLPIESHINHRWNFAHAESVTRP